MDNNLSNTYKKEVHLTENSRLRISQHPDIIPYFDLFFICNFFTVKVFVFPTPKPTFFNLTLLWNFLCYCNINYIIHKKISIMKNYFHEDNIFKLLINEFVTSTYFFLKRRRKNNWKERKKNEAEPMKRVIYFKITFRPFNFFSFTENRYFAVWLISAKRLKKWQVMPGPWFCEFGDTRLMAPSWTWHWHNKF